MGAELLEKINEKKKEARLIDKQLIENPVHVQKHLTQIEGVNRSGKYVHRLAGISTDIYRKSRNEMLVEWFGATAIDNPAQAIRFKAFWQPLFDFAEGNSFNIKRDFWTTQEETDALLSKLRTAFLTGNKIEARNTLLQIMQNAKEMLTQIDTQELNPQIIIAR